MRFFLSQVPDFRPKPVLSVVSRVFFPDPVFLKPSFLVFPQRPYIFPIKHNRCVFFLGFRRWHPCDEIPTRSIEGYLLEASLLQQVSSRQDTLARPLYSRPCPLFAIFLNICIQTTEVFFLAVCVPNQHHSLFWDPFCHLFCGLPCSHPGGKHEIYI